MKKNEMIRLASVISLIIILAGIGFFVQYKRVPKESQKPVINFYVQNLYPTEEADSSKAELEKILSTDKFNVSIKISKNTLVSAIEENAGDASMLHAGIFMPGSFFKADLAGTDFEPLQAISPNPNQQCFLEAKFTVMKNSGINDIRKLNGKNVAVTRGGMRAIHLLFKELEEKKIHFDKIYLYREPQWVIENLKNKTIAAAILSYTKVTESKKSKDELGVIIDNQYEDKELNLKILTETDFKSPCKIYFVSKKLDPMIKEELTKNLLNAMDNDLNLPTLRDVGGMSSATALSAEEVTRFRNYYKSISRHTLKDFSSSVVE